MVENNIVIQQKNRKLFLIPIIHFIVLAGGITYFYVNRPTTRTIMIYMVGSDLETDSALASTDIKRINGNLVDLENVNVLLIAGGAYKWHNELISEKESSIFKLTSNGFKKIKTQQLLNMGNTEVLTDFLNYVKDNYDTKEYDLIFWNHGGAIDGSEYDQNFRNDNLSLTELEESIKNSKFKNHKLETVIFRTCLNGTIEMANVFKNYADYLVASEEVTVGGKNVGVLNFINDITTSDDGLSFSKKYINSYKNQIKELKDLLSLYSKDDSIYSSYSVVDLSNTDILINAVNDFFNEIDLKNNYNTIARIRSNTFQYGEMSGSYNYDMVDLYNIITDLKELNPEQYTKVMEAFNKVVKYNWSTDESSRGISIYFPYKGEKDYRAKFLIMYSDFTDLKDYNTFISNFNGLKEGSSSKKFTFNSNAVDVTEKDELYDFKLELSDEQKENYAKAKLLVFESVNGDYYHPIFTGTDVKLDENVLMASVEDKLLKVVNKVKDTGMTLPIYEIDRTEDYIKYSSIIILDDYSNGISLKNAYMNIIVDKDHPAGIISDIIIDSKNDLPNNLVANVNDYDYIEFLSTSYKILNDDGSYNTDWEGSGEITGISLKPDDFNIEKEQFDSNKTYFGVFQVFDVNNNYYYSNLIKL